MTHEITIFSVQFRTTPAPGSKETLDIEFSYKGKNHQLELRIGQYEKRPTFSITGWYEILGFDTQRLSDFRRAVVTAHLGELSFPYSF